MQRHNVRNHAVQMFLVLLLVSIAAGSSTVTVGTRVEPERLAVLTRGVNIGQWFPNGNSSTTVAIAEEDIQRIRGLGFTHVRLPIDPALLLNEADPDTLNSDMLAALDRALNMIAVNDLAVIVDMHPTDTFKQRLAMDDAFVHTVALFWRSLALHLRVRSPQLVFLEVLNEPGFERYVERPVGRWRSVQGELLAAMREGAPEHTLIASGHDMNSIGSLIELTPYADQNILYNIHFYEPLIFTHQGAAWGSAQALPFANVPYPSSLSAVEPLLGAFEGSTRDQLETYGRTGWNRDMLAMRIARVTRWSQRFGVQVIGTEFGVYGQAAPPADRAHWIADVRSLLEENRIGWTFWEYTGAFGIIDRQMMGTRTPDEAVLSALGLGATALPAADPPP